MVDSDERKQAEPQTFDRMATATSQASPEEPTSQVEHPHPVLFVQDRMSSIQQLQLYSSSGTESEDEEEDSSSSTSSVQVVHDNIILSEDDEDTSSSSSSSEEEAEERTQVKKKNPAVKKRRKSPPRTFGEISLDDLPPIEDLHITVPEQETQEIGVVQSIVDKLCVVQAHKGLPPIDMDSILFLKGGNPIGKVFELFGQVSEPLYAIRFNNREEIEEKGIKVGMPVYWAPDRKDITNYVFMEQIKKLPKGSDASWEHNNEPPEDALDYSDDEQERLAKAKMSGRKKAENGHSVANGYDQRPKNTYKRQRTEGPLVRPAQFQPTMGRRFPPGPQAHQQGLPRPPRSTEHHHQQERQPYSNPQRFGGFPQAPMPYGYPPPNGQPPPTPYAMCPPPSSPYSFGAPAPMHPPPGFGPMPSFDFTRPPPGFTPPPVPAWSHMSPPQPNGAYGAHPPPPSFRTMFPTATSPPPPPPPPTQM